MMSMLRALRTLALLCAVILSTAPATRAETSYQPTRAETAYGTASETSYGVALPPPGSVAKAREMGAVTSGETRYNPLGTTSAARIGLVSTRRGQPAYRGFLTGMQAAAIKREGQPLNVAPLDKLTLADQAAELAERGVDLFLVDAPDPAEAREFFDNARVLGRRAVLLARSLPRGYNPAMVVDTPVLHAERAGEEAIRLVGNTDVRVAYVLGEHEPPAPVENYRETVRATFLKPFRNVAPRIEVVELDLAASADTLVPPAVIVCLTEEDSATVGIALRNRYPQSRIVLVGESGPVVDTFEAKRADIRVRPDYTRLLDNALREAAQKSTMPIILQPTIDRWW